MQGQTNAVLLLFFFSLFMRFLYSNSSIFLQIPDCYILFKFVVHVTEFSNIHASDYQTQVTNIQ